MYVHTYLGSTNKKEALQRDKYLLFIFWYW